MAAQAKLIRSFWETRQRGIAVLSEDWLDESTLPPLFYSEAKLPFNSIEPVPPQRFGERACYYMEHGKLVFLLKPDYYPNIDFWKESVHVLGTFNDWKGIEVDDWALKPEKINGQDYWLLRVDPKDCLPRTKPALFKFITKDGHWLEPHEEAPNIAISKDGVRNLEIRRHRTGRHIFYFTLEVPIGALEPQCVVWDDGRYCESEPISYGYLLFRSKTDVPLGVSVSHRRTCFRLFAPRADKVTVYFCERHDAPIKDWGAIELSKVEPTTWEAVVDRNLENFFYYYTVAGTNADGFSHFDDGFRILDPYAKATVGPTGPGIILSEGRLHPVGPCHEPPPWHNLTILEAHVRDLLEKAPIHLSAKERKGFAGLTAWLRDEHCYLRTLGVNAVELLPVQEFDAPSPDQYHWGYMTNNYFAPSSSYALEPTKASQVEEFRDLVHAFHDAGLSVILDVVYNHVGEPNHLLFIDKYYYFETDAEGNLMNWSGCGNDFRAHTPMGTRLIIDSLVHLVKTYDVDGFRFDLAELLGVDVLREVEAALKAVKPSIILIAEPWSFRGHMAMALKSTGFSSWNDGYRDFLCKYILGEGNGEGMAYFLEGSTRHLASWPAQTVNYTASHDDFCWLDRITERANNDGTQPTSHDRRCTHLMFSLLLVSLGIPMIAEGQDMMRSKQGVHNTYQRGDLNALDYKRGVIYSGTQLYVRKWLDFRASHEGRFLRLEHKPSPGYFKHVFHEGSSALVTRYNADGSLGDGGLMFAINPHDYEVYIKIEDEDPERYVQIADHECFEATGIVSKHRLWMDGRICLPPMTCALWKC